MRLQLEVVEKLLKIVYILLPDGYERVKFTGVVGSPCQPSRKNAFLRFERGNLAL